MMATILGYPNGDPVAPGPLLDLRDVSIRFGQHLAVDKLNLRMNVGERLALVGESGSGKTVTALSVLRLLANAKIDGEIRFQGEDLLQKPVQQLRQIRGSEIAMIFQEPMTALNPLYSIGNQVIETLQLHEGLSRKEAREKTLHLFERTGIREPQRRIDSLPHQLSGGQRQRAMIAMALACKPKLLIADEPTTALDTTIRARILKLLLDLQQEEGMAVLLITHDLNLVRRFAQRVAVMERGKLVESGETEALYQTPQHSYTIKLLNSRPQREIDPVPPQAPVLLQTERLRVEYPKPLPGWRGLLRADRFVAVAGATLDLREGETVGIVGESGSGKSTLAQAILSLVPVRSGAISFDGQALDQRSRQQTRALRARLQVVFQDPFGALSPRRTVEQIVGEGLELHFPELDKPQRRAKIVQVLADVGLPPSALGSYPHEFSGGQRQRIAIARTLVLAPQVLVLDEPTSALDVSIQNQVLQLLVRLQKKYGLSYVLITHDLAVVHAMAHRLYVMHEGEIIESGETQTVIANPRHPYTQRLVSASF